MSETDEKNPGSPPDQEPVFVLRGSDPDAPMLMILWAHMRSRLAEAGVSGQSAEAKRAADVAVSMEDWRRHNAPQTLGERIESLGLKGRVPFDDETLEALRRHEKKILEQLTDFGSQDPDDRRVHDALRFVIRWCELVIETGNE